MTWRTNIFASLLLWTQFNGGFAASVGESPALLLLPAVQVDSEGVFLSQVVSNSSGAALPQIRLSDAPAFGQALLLPRAQVIALAQKAAPELVSTNIAGVERVRVTRRVRALTEAEIKDQITALLQRDLVRDKGELELRLSRPWVPIAIPAEPYTVKILDVPTTGVSANFITRFQLSTAHEVVGTWQLAAQAKVWREVWTARSPLKSGTLFSAADVERERRDLLSLHEAPLTEAQPSAALELAEMVPAGAPLYVRSVRPHPVIYRGQVVEAQVRDGAMVISLKVEALENGAPGQFVRVRNVTSKREFRGKVQNEQTIQVVL